MHRYKIGIIGYGDFSKLMIERLASYADIVVSSRQDEKGDAGFGAQFASIEEVLSQPIIIPAIPSQFFEEFFIDHKDKLRSDSLVVDVCSVKMKPLSVLERLLPQTCHIIGTHPLFGPASVNENGGIRGLKCVVCPVRISNKAQDEFISFLENILELKVLIKTPEEHDNEMAYVQGLSHYIGRIMGIMNIPTTELATLAYDDLLGMKNVQGNDSWDLFNSIMSENPYALEVNQLFKRASRDLDTRLGI